VEQTRPTATRPARGNKTFSLVLRAIVLAGTLAILSSVIDVASLGGLMLNMSPWVVLVALAVGVGRCALTSMRWRLLNPDPTAQLSSWHYFRYMMLSNTFNLFMPGALGGDIVRSVLVVRSVGEHRGSNLFAILADRVVGLFSILVLGTIACAFAPGLPERWKHLAFLLTLVVLFLATVALAMSGIVARLAVRALRHLGTAGQSGIRALQSLRSTLEYYRANRGRTCLALLLCLPIHASWFVIVYMMARSLGMEISFLTLSTVSALVWVVTAVPISFSGLGVRELSFVFLLGIHGISSESATALSLYQFIITVLLGIVGAGFLMFKGPQLRNSTQADQATEASQGPPGGQDVPDGARALQEPARSQHASQRSTPTHGKGLECLRDSA